jgi:hypothetical protein
MKKCPPGHETTRRATYQYQGLSIDFGFIGQKSKNDKRKHDYTGRNGETCYILIADHSTQTLAGATRISKASPLNWLRQWLSRHSPTVDNKYVVLDQGGELYKNPKIRALFLEYNYDVIPTGADSSHQNAPVERPHQTIGNALCSMLSGANLDARFWPYAFDLFLRIHNALPHQSQTHSPHKLTHKTKAQFQQLRTFGCRVWVRPLANAVVASAHMPRRESSSVTFLTPPKISFGMTLNLNRLRLPITLVSTKT